MRDLQKDLEICNRATQGPWVFEEYDVDIWSQADPWRVANVGLHADMEFIAQAREGWPHAIERAIKAEAEVERLRLMVKSITGGLDEAIEIGDYLEAENALLRKVEEVGEILWSEAICHRCEARECRGCSAHDFKKALSEYQSWKERQELDKEGE